MKTKFTILLFLLLSFQIGKSQYTIDFSANSTAICKSQPILFSSSSSPTNTINWHWEFGDGDTSNLQSPTHLYYNGGNYTVSLFASDGVNNDTLIKQDYITVFEIIPNPTYTISGSTASFIDSSYSINSTIINWYWDFENDGNIDDTTQNPIYTYANIDSCYFFTLTLENNASCITTLMGNIICISSITTFHELKERNIYTYPLPLSNYQNLIIKGKLKGLEKIISYDVLGNLISFPIISKNENELIFETNQLNKGVYFLQLHFDDKAVITKKVVVQ